MDLPLVPFNDLKRVYGRFSPQIGSEVSRVLASGWWISGKSVENFAADFQRAVGVKHCIPVANGTDALEIALKVVAQPGKAEVVTVANAGGYVSTAARSAGLVPMFADIERDSLLMSISSAIMQVGNNTAAVVATHLFGSVVDIDELRRSMDAAGYPGVPIIEDCAQAHGATLGSRCVGSLADIGTYSFYPTKNLGAVGDAGAIVTNSDTYAARASSIRQYGWREKYHIGYEGGRNSRMDEIQAAVLSVMLPYLSELNSVRAQIRNTYRISLSNSVVIPKNAEGGVTHLIPLLVENRDGLRKHLQRRGIGTEIHYPILDCDQEAWTDLKRIDLPVSKWAVERILSIPCFVGMTEREQNAVCEAINGFYK